MEGSGSASNTEPPRVKKIRGSVNLFICFILFESVVSTGDWWGPEHAWIAGEGHRPHPQKRRFSGFWARQAGSPPHHQRA
jgi:hypothetical protein